MRKLAAFLGLVLLLPLTLTVQLTEVDNSPLHGISISVTIDDVSAQVTFRSATTSQSTSDTSRSPADPSGGALDDSYIAVAWIDIEDGTWTIPSGWTEIEDHLQDVAVGHTNVSRIVRGASAPNLTWSYSGTADDIRVTVYAFEGVHTTTSLDVVYVTGDHYTQATDDPTAANAAITTINDNAMVVLIQITEFSGSGTPGAPSTFSLDVTGDGSKPQHHLAYKIQASAGLVTPGVWTHTGFNSSDDPVGLTLALREASTVDNALLRRRGR